MKKKIYYVKSLIIMILLIIQNFQLYSQVNSPFQYVYINGDKNAHYETINFIDTIENKLLASLNLIDQNPFNNVNYSEVVSHDKNGTETTFAFHNMSIDDIIIPNQKLVVRQGFNSSRKQIKLRAFTFYQATIKNKYLVVVYYFSVYSNEEIIGRSDAIYIYDSRGNLVRKLYDFDTNVREWDLTDDGKYFSFAFGSILDESSDVFCDVGYKIIDIQKGNVVYQENFGNEFSEIRTRSIGNMIKIVCFSTSHLYIFFNFSKNKKYSRSFSREERSLWKNQTKDGLVIFVGHRNSNKLGFLSFEKDFKMEDIK